MHISFEALLDSLNRGNEIQFELNGDIYTLYPHWVGEAIVGYCIGKLYAEIAEVDSIGLREYSVGKEKLGTMCDKIKIIDSTLGLQ